MNDKPTLTHSSKKKVLISYCQQDHEKHFIRGLAYDLDKAGLDVQWDKGDGRKENFSEWFMDELKKSDFVLMVFSARYKACYENPSRYQASYESDSVGIVPEIEILKDLLQTRKTPDATIDRWRIISVFPTNAKRKLDLIADRDRMVPLGLGAGKYIFGLDFQQKDLLDFLKRDGKPADYGRENKFKVALIRGIRFLSIANDRLGRTLRSFGLLALSGLLALLTWCLYQYPHAISNLLNIASESEQLTLVENFSHQKNLLTDIEGKIVKNSAELKIHVSTEHNDTNSKAQTFFKNWKPELNDNTSFVQITNLQKQVAALKTNLTSIKTIVTNLPSLEKINEELLELETYTNSDREKDSKIRECFQKAEASVARTNEALNIIKLHIIAVKKEIKDRKPDRDDNPHPEQGKQSHEPSTFSNQQTWFFYNTARNHFFSGDYQTAIQLLDQGLALGNEDGRLYYMRSLANRRLGLAFDADLYRAIELEIKKRPSTSIINRSLERIQGDERLWLENRREASRTP